MPDKMRWFTTALIAWMLLATFPALSQIADLTLSEVEAILEEVAREMAAGRYDEAARQMGRLGDPYNGENVGKALLGFASLGKPLYHDKVIDKAYGKTGKDLIYKVGYDQNILFLRFILHKRHADHWVVSWFAGQAEVQAPLPRVWNHVYP